MTTERTREELIETLKTIAGQPCYGIYRERDNSETVALMDCETMVKAKGTLGEGMTLGLCAPCRAARALGREHAWRPGDV